MIQDDKVLANFGEWWCTVYLFIIYATYKTCEWLSDKTDQSTGALAGCCICVGFFLGTYFMIGLGHPLIGILAYILGFGFGGFFIYRHIKKQR